MIADEQNRNQPSEWEEEAPAEPRYRRVQQSVPASGRVLPGMPLEMAEDEDDEALRSETPRFSRTFAPRGPWWRPATSWGRGLLALGALTAAAALGVASWALHNFLAHDSRFRIASLSNIEADGLSEVSRTEMLPVFGEDVGRNIFFVNLSDRRKQLEQIPWVEKATVMRLLPDHIRVQVVERHPVAFVRQGSQIGLVDINGVLLSMPPAMMAQRHYSFPVVSGINTQDAPEARRQRMALYLQLIHDLDADGRGISSQLSEIDLSNPEDVRVMLPDAQGEVLAHFGEDHFRERYQRYSEQIGTWRAKYPRLASVDLRCEDQLVLTMKNEEPAAPAPPTAPAQPVTAQSTSVVASAPTAPAHSAENKPATPAQTAKVQTPAKTEAEKPHSAQKEPAKTVKAAAHPATPGKADGKKPKAAEKKSKDAGNRSKAAHANATTAAAKSKAAKKKDTKTLQVAEKGNHGRNDSKKQAEAKRASANPSGRRRSAPIRPALDQALGQ